MNLSRYKRNWNLVRVIFLFLGLWMIWQSWEAGQWIGIVLGSWPALMGLFGLGCAGNSCVKSYNNKEV